MYDRFNNPSDNEEIFEFYNTNYNYEIREGNGKGTIIIFFTGHGLYFPTTIEEFRKAVVKNDRYEWKNVSSDNRITQISEKFIYVRDVYKNWSINGINGKINSQEKVAVLLRKLVGKKNVITVGSSAGGYMALLYGMLLNASKIYTFSPQVNLHEYYVDHPYLYYEDYCNNDDILKFMDLKPMIRRFKGDIYYWYPANCLEDVRQFNSIRNCGNIHFFAIKQNKHGNTIWGESIIVSLSMESNVLNSLCLKHKNTVISPFVYCIKTSGIIKALEIAIGRRIKQIIRHKS